MRKIFLAAVAATVCTGQGQAQDQVENLFYRSLNFVGYSLAQSAVLAIRSRGEITYDAIDVDARAGLIALNGVRFTPALRHGTPGACTVTAESLAIEGQIWGEVTSARFTFSGVSFPASCLPPEQGVMVAAVGYPIIRAEHVAADATYVMGASSLDVTLSGEVEDALSFEAVAAFDYFWLGDDALPAQARSSAGSPTAADLAFAEVSLSDAGAIERLGPMLGVMIGGLANAPTIATQGMRDSLTEGGTLPLAPEADSFINDLEAGLTGLLNRREDLVISVSPATPVRLSGEIAEDPALLLAALSPAVSQHVVARSEIISADLLAQVLTGPTPNALSNADRLAVGRALSLGLGAPLAPGAARELLAPLVDDWLPEAAFLSAKAALVQGQQEEAYRLSLIAAAGGVSDAQAMLSVLEARLPGTAIFGAQQAVSNSWPDGDDAADAVATAAQAGDIAALRAAARDRHTGRNGPRSYEQAYVFASLAAAAGDRSAADLRDRLSKRFLARSDVDRTAWADVVARAELTALDAWLSLNLADAFAAAD